MPRFTTSEVIGIAATVVSVATIFASISMISIPYSVQRFFGKSFAENKIEDVKMFVKTSLILLTIGIAASSLVILIASDWVSNNFGIDFSLIILAILLIASTCFTRLFRGVLIASQKTKMLPIIFAVAGIIKIVLAVILVSIGTGELGVTIGFTSFFIVASILLAITVVMLFNTSKKKSEIKFKDSVKNILNASFVNWIPTLIGTLGVHLGTVVVFGSQGADQTGVYFIAFAISVGISSVILAMLEYAYPLLSGMTDGRKKFSWRIMKVSFVFGLPIVSVLMFFSKNILQVFGENYIEGSFALEILLISIPVLVIGQGVRTLTYAYGNYTQVLWLGLGLSLPRIILYFILVPLYGTSGAAFSFTLGSMMGLIVAIFIAKKIQFKIIWHELGLIIIIPTILAFILSYFETNIVFSAFVIILGSYILFIRFGMINRQDLHDSIGVLPEKIAIPTIKFVDKIALTLKHSY